MFPAINTPAAARPTHLTPWPTPKAPAARAALDDEASALAAIDAYAEPEAPALSDTRAPRVWTRPTVDRLEKDFCRTDRLPAAQLALLERRCVTLEGFRAALHEYVVAAILRRPDLAHEYRYPHPRSLERMHTHWLRKHAATLADYQHPSPGAHLYEQLKLATQAVPL